MISALILVSLVLITLGQLLQKLAADRAAATGPLMRGLLRRWELWLAIACLVAGTAVWLVVLAGMEVSKAYPALSLSVVLTTVASRVWLRERVPIRRWLGVGLITVGVLLVSSS